MLAALISKLTLYGRRSRRTARSAVLLVAIASLAGIASMAQDTFTAGSGLWSVTSNWSLNRLPMPSDDCIIPAGSVVTDDAAGECANFTLGTGGSVTATPGYLFVYGTSLVNHGTISVGSGNGLGIEESPGVTTSATGGGTINMTSASSRISGAGAIFANVDNTIQGQGGVGLGTIGLVNNSLINANVPSATLAVQSNAQGVTNTGTMQASNGGTLQLVAGFVSTPFNNTGGTIQALSGSTVNMAGYTLTGGTLSTSGTGVFTIVPANNTILNNLTNAGTYQLINGANTTIQGTLTNSGTFQALNGGLLVSGNATLKGAGVVTGATGPLLGSYTIPATLLNQSTIQGGGTIGDNNLTITNQGTIDANNTSNSMVTAGPNALTNTSIMEATGGATLEIRNVVNNTGGIITAQNGSTVLLSTGTINGGTLSSSGTGAFQTTSGTLDGTVNIPTNAGLFNVPNGDNLLTKGTINNTGTIALGPGGGCIGLEASTKITGSGQVTMTPNSCFLAFSVGLTLTNQSTISGAGSIGDSNPMAIINQGTITANQSTPLLIVPNSTGFTNQGTLIVNSGSVMGIQNLFKNISKNKLTGGVYGVAGTLNINNANIINNNASIMLSGPSAQIFDTLTSSSALRNLAANSAKGVLSLTLGQHLAVPGSFTNAGTVTIDATSAFTVGSSFTQTAGTTTVDGTLTAPSGFIFSKGKFFGKGTVAAAFSSTGSGVLTVGDSVNSPGVLSVASFSQGATGVTDVSIGGRSVGTQYSQLASSNGVSLGGILTVKRIKGFVPAIGNTFTIITGSAITGQFATVNGLSINSSEHFQINYTGTAVTLTVMSGP